jgi:hypothetical protein
MLLAPSFSGLFKRRQFDPAVLLLAVGWYLRFLLSHRDVEELLADRGVHADHVTAWRWVQCYAPEMQRRLRSRLNSTNDSWRVDETYIRVKSKWVLSLWLALPRVAKFSFGEALALVDNRRLWGRALGWTDIHLLTSALVSRTRLWTRDRLLRDTAGQLLIPIKA